MENDQWKSLLRWLRKTFPLKGVVVVKRSPRKKGCGSADVFIKSRKQHYIIYVNSMRAGTVQKDTLLHEWAHLCVYDDAFEHDHDSMPRSWKDHFGEIYESWASNYVTTRLTPND